MAGGENNLYLIDGFNQTYIEFFLASVFFIYYSVMNSTRATQSFSAKHKASSEQKNQSLFVSNQSQMKDLRPSVHLHPSVTDLAELGCSPGF